MSDSYETRQYSVICLRKLPYSLPLVSS